jgi:ABC-type transport system involved in cytochrome c biogenesis ATPase subunit
MNAVVFSARGIACPGSERPEGLSFTLGPGLTLLRGGDGRGKSSLLRLIAGDMIATAGLIQRRAHTVFLEDPADATHDQTVGHAWLAAQAARFPAWRATVEAGLIEGFALAEHMAKPMFMLSAGSRRKLGLVAAAASGAELTLLDTPYAALDARSGRLLSELLAEAAEGRERAWVIADYELPAGLVGVLLAGVIDLGD